MPDRSPQDQLSHLMSGYWHTQAIYVAAELKLADLLKDGPRTAEELALATKTSPHSLYRLLRALASVGIFAEDEQCRFGLTPMAEYLRSDVPGSQWSMALLRGGLQYEAWGQLLHSIQTGQSAFEKIHGMPIFDYFARNQEQGKLFDAAMTGVHGQETTAMLEAYDFAGIGTLADIGGGNGSVITAVLHQYPAKAEGDGGPGATPGGRGRGPTRQRTVREQVLRSGDDGAARRPGANGNRIPTVVSGCRVPHGPDRPGEDVDQRDRGEALLMNPAIAAE